MATQVSAYGKRFGESQISNLLCIGRWQCKLIEVVDLRTSKRTVSLKGEMPFSPIHRRLKARDILRLLHKGALKVKSVKIKNGYMVYEYELTSLFSKLFKSLKNFSKFK